MRRWPSYVLGIVIGLVAVFGHAAPADAQIKWTPTYLDGPIQAGGFGFADPTVPTGETKSLGLLRRESVTAAFDYLNTVLDGRGTVNVEFGPSFSNVSDPTLASFGTTFVVQNGSFQNGQAYQAARTNVRAFEAFPDSDGQFNFGHQYNYATQSQAPASNRFDMTTVAIHELMHGNGFLNLVKQNGQGLGGSPPPAGQPSVYSVYDSQLVRGNAPGTPQFNTDITSANYASFTGNTSTFTNQNNPTTGLFFGGQFAREVFGGAVPLFAPAIFEPGSSIGHDNTSPEGVMHPNTPFNTVRRLRPYEIAMLLDMGWNVYNWDNGTGNWLDGVNPGNPNDLNVANSNWRTNRGIVFQEGQLYNINSNQDQAPVLPPSGQMTSNIVLNFGGSGTTGYTATNDIGTVRLSRLNLNSSNTTTPNTITGGTLLFGQDAPAAGGSASVLFPKIMQQGPGAFVIASAIQIPNGLTVDGTGAGRVTLSGPISGNGGLTKAGGFTMILSGNSTYSGGTTVGGGRVLVNGQTGSNSGTGSGTVTVMLGTLGGNGRIGGALQAPGGIVAPGDMTTADVSQPGILTVGNGVSFNSAAQFAVQLNGTTTGTNYDQLLVEGGNVLLGNATLAVTIGYTPDLADRLVILNNTGSGTTTGQFSNFAPGAPVNVGGTTVYAYYNYDVATGLFGSGNDVVLTFAPIPEPAAVLALGAVALGLVGLFRRWRQERLAGREAGAPQLSA